MAEGLSIAAILSFIEKLPSGFANGPRELLAVRELFLRMAELGELPADKACWKTLLAPIVCGDEDQQAEFYSRFDAEFAERREPVPPAPNGPAVAPPPEIPWRAAIAAVVCLSVFGFGGLWLARLFQPISEPPMPKAPVSFLKPPMPETPRTPRPVLVAEARVTSPDGLPLSGATVWAPMDLVTNQQRRVTTDAQGRFRVPMGAGPFQLLVSHPDYEPVFLERAQDEIRVGRPRSERTVWEMVPASAVRLFPAWISAALGAIPLFAALWLLWRNEKRRAMLESFEGPLDLQPVRIHARSQEEELFRDADVAILARELRKRRPEPTGRLAVEPTIARTVERGGVFTPVRLERKVEREFLVLVERKSDRDQQARFWDCLLQRLVSRGVAIERYQFAGDPRACEAPGAERAWVRLSELAALHPGHELWVLAAAERFFDAVTGEPAPWLEELARWPERAVIRLTEGTEEDEAKLRESGFAVAPASVAGLTGLQDERGAVREETPPYPLALEDGEARWMPGTPAATEREIRSLLRQLRAWMGGNGYRLLLACAVYPELAWSLTLHLALALIPERREDVLARLVRLPWFRHGRMPEWLRAAMVREMTDADAARVLAALREFLRHKTSAAAAGRGELELVRPDRGRAGAKKRDFVYLAFLSGRKPNARELEAPEWWRRLLYPDGVRLFGLRRWVVVAGGLVAAGLLWMGAEMAARVKQDATWRERSVPPSVAQDRSNELALVAAEVAAASVGQASDARSAMRTFERALPFVGAAWTAAETSNRAGALLRKDDLAGVTERVTAEGVVVIQPFQGRLERVLWPGGFPVTEFRRAVLQDVYFDTSALREDARATLTKNAAVMKAILQSAPGTVFVIEGHTDERGSSESGIALGDQFASAAREYLAQLAVPGAVMKTVSYGKERPVCTEATEDCWQRNRRVHIAVDTNREPAPGSGKINPVDGLRYNWIPPGRFRMGCSPGDNECFPDEKPPVDVEITRGFRIGETEVTQGAYQRVRGTNPSSFKGAQRPVESMTWDDARNYCAAIGGRLPTEAEWEYAARAGSAAARYGALDEIAWYDKEQNFSGQTHDVKGKLPNAWGLYDMLGNVYEWTATWYGPLEGGRDPRGPAKGNIRALRGGSWLANPEWVRASLRSGFDVLFHFPFSGFRCAWDIP